MSWGRLMPKCAVAGCQFDADIHDGTYCRGCSIIIAREAIEIMERHYYAQGRPLTYEGNTEADDPYNIVYSSRKRKK
jgi:hypothetical protein